MPPTFPRRRFALRLILATSLATVACTADPPISPSGEPEAARGAPAQPLHWSSIPLPTGMRPVSLWASSPTNIFFLGYGVGDSHNSILRFDGASWSVQYTGGLASYGQIWGASPHEVYAVVGSSTVLANDRGTWHDVGPEQDEDTWAFHSIWGTHGHRLFAGGDDEMQIPVEGLIAIYSGKQWLKQKGLGFETYGLVYDFSGTSPTDVYAVGEESPYDAEPEENSTRTAVLHYDGATWSTSLEYYYYFSEGDGYFLKAVWANASDDVFAVATAGRIFHFDGSAWTPMRSPTTDALRDVWGRSSREVYATGDGGTFLYDGATWTRVDDTPGVALWGTNNDLFIAAVGQVRHAER